MSFVQYILMNEKNLQTIEQVIIHTHSKESKKTQRSPFKFKFYRMLRLWYFTQILK